MQSGRNANPVISSPHVPSPGSDSFGNGLARTSSTDRISVGLGSQLPTTPISYVLSKLIPGFAAQFFQLVEAWSALSDVGEKSRLLNVTGSFRESQQGIDSRTTDALRIGKVLMDHPFKRFQQFLFRTHSAPRSSNMEFEPARHSCPLGESHDSRVMSMKFWVRARATRQSTDEFGRRAQAPGWKSSGGINPGTTLSIFRRRALVPSRGSSSAARGPAGSFLSHAKN